MELDKKRIVVKVGTSSITAENGEANLRQIDLLCRTISGVQSLGYDMILVSSGAISVGANKMRLAQKPKEVRMKQAAAAVGQCELMHLYDRFFAEYGKITGQILVTSDDIEGKGSRENLTNTFDALLENRIIPIVNENDSVSHNEIQSEKMLFSDNDMLSAIVAVFCRAATLVVLTDIDGLYDANPAVDPGARLISRVERIDDGIRTLAKGTTTNRGTGGMISKLDAAEYAMEHGVDMFITNGKTPEKIYDIVDHKIVGKLLAGKKV
ncbi:MAG: glutamate 5-kinase [Lachnospiraceae bacterium]|nr:glutamate 5-kinase [Lachnospiraceae bacterium]